MLHRILVLGLLAGVVATAAPARAKTAIPVRGKINEIRFHNDIHVLPGAPINDAVCFFCSVRADGPINGDVIVFFGSVRINGQTANHDLIDFFGTVRVEDNSTVGADLVHIGGPTYLGNNVFIGSGLTAIFSDLHTTPSTRVIGDRMVIPTWTLLLPLIFAILIVILIAYITQSRRRPRIVYRRPR